MDTQRRWVCLLTVLLGVIAASKASAAEREVSLQIIEDAWRKREVAWKEFDISWSESVVAELPVRSSGPDPFGPDKPENLAYGQGSGTCRLAVSDNRTRFESFALGFDRDRGRFATKVRTHVCNDPDITVKGQSMPMNSALRNAHIMLHTHPVLDHFQPSYNLIRLLRKGKLDPELKIMGDATCAGVTCELDGGGHPSGKVERIFKMWMSLDEGFAIRRTTTQSAKGANRIHEIDRWYQKDNQIGWVPSKWRIVNTKSDGKLHSSYDGELVSCEINKPIAGDLFARPGVFNDPLK